MTTTANYTITTQNFGHKYRAIFPHWMYNTSNHCPNANIVVPEFSTTEFGADEVVRNSAGNVVGWVPKGEAFWDVVRLDNNIKILKETRRPVVHCDLDVILTKAIDPIIRLSQNYDMVFSAETWGQPLNFCSGFYILNNYRNRMANADGPHFAEHLLEMMRTKRFKTYSDQNTLRQFISEQEFSFPQLVEIGLKPISLRTETCILDNKEYTNSVISFTYMGQSIVICILDMGIITRDPMETRTQFGNHINVDNVGGPETFIRFFYERIEDLPLTCRCGKAHLGNTDMCVHRRSWVNSIYSKLYGDSK